MDAVQDVVQSSLRQVQEGNGGSLSERERTDLKRRKLLLEVCVGMGAQLDGGGGGRTIRAPLDLCVLFSTLKSYWIRKGSAFSTAVVRQETDLTPEMIAT